MIPLLDSKISRKQSNQSKSMAINPDHLERTGHNDEMGKKRIRDVEQVILTTFEEDFHSSSAEESLLALSVRLIVSNSEKSSRF